MQWTSRSGSVLPVVICSEKNKTTKHARQVVFRVGSSVEVLMARGIICKCAFFCFNIFFPWGMRTIYTGMWLFFFLIVFLDLLKSFVQL